MNLILGGTHGLGGEIARNLRDRGEETFVVGRSYDRATHGPGMRIDLLNEENLQDLGAHIEDMGLASLKRFFWVSGRHYKGDFSRQPDARGLALVNFANGLTVLQSAWNKMLNQAGNDKPDIVVISSTSGLRPRPDEAVYTATKHAQVGLVKSLQLEAARLADCNITVTLFEPGGMKTDLYGDNPPSDYDTFLDPMKVAARICDSIIDHVDYMPEEEIPRGSL